MAITPNSDLYLIKCPLELDNRNQITFNNETNQSNYFKNLPHLLVEDITYQRKDSIIRYPAHIDSIIGYNYCMYKNNNYSNKWFYAYITGMRYINDNMTEISIKTDVFQTWQHNLTYKQSFIEREHVTDDTPGKHTVPEQLEMGEYIVDNKIQGRPLGTAGEVIVASTLDLTKPLSESGKFNSIGGSYYGDVYCGPTYFAINTAGSMKAILERLASEGQSDGINSMFMGSSLFYSTNFPTGTNVCKVIDDPEKRVASWEYATTIDHTVIQIKPPNKATTLNTYQPRNKKLLTFPYCYLMVSNNAGSNAIYHYELFNNPTSANKCDFRHIGTITPGMSIRLQPLYYNGQEVNNEEGLNAGKLPTCSWSTDVYTNWLTQNGVNIGLSVAGSVVGLVGSAGLIVSGGGAGAGATGIVSNSLAIASTLNQVYQHSLTPPQSEGNTNNGDVIFSSGNSRFTIYQMSIKKEYAKIIDDYFSMYGYKVNTLKQIAINTRTNWNFIKTIGANIEGDIPQNDMQEIKKLFDNGITLWHTTSHFLDYSQNNQII